MPMTTPSTVSPERSLFLRSVRREISNRSNRDTCLPRCEGAFGPGDEVVALGQSAVEQLGELVLDQPEGNGDGPQQVALAHPDDAVMTAARALGLLGGA